MTGVLVVCARVRQAPGLKPRVSRPSAPQSGRSIDYLDATPQASSLGLTTRVWRFRNSQMAIFRGHLLSPFEDGNGLCHLCLFASERPLLTSGFKQLRPGLAAGIPL